MTHRSLPITTLKPGDSVKVHLRGRVGDAIHTWGGSVVAVDGVAVRIKASWKRFCLCAVLVEGEKVIPWGRIERISMEAPS